ncbi:MAG TPA: thioesterase family protein [Fluviicoccus sp.]|nr:thioesterase family protein [Fluviicoccus sp.]
MNPSELGRFPLVLPQDVAWGDMDAFGHVNNAVYYRYFESARIAYLQAIGALDHLEAFNPVVAANSCRFLRPVVYPDALQLGARVVELRGSGFRMEYVLFSRAQAALAATGEAVVVMVGADGRKIPLSEALRQAILTRESAAGNEVLFS